MSSDNKENELPLEMILQRSFESIWYQSEVLHKRTFELVKEKFDANDKRIEALEKWNDKINETIRDRIMMFSQDIIATMKEMIGNLQASHAHAYCHPSHFVPRHTLAASGSVADREPLDEEEEQDPQPEEGPCLLEEDQGEEEDSAQPLAP